MFITFSNISHAFHSRSESILASTGADKLALLSDLESDKQATQLEDPSWMTQTKPGGMGLGDPPGPSPGMAL